MACVLGVRETAVAEYEHKFVTFVMHIFYLMQTQPQAPCRSPRRSVPAIATVQLLLFTAVSLLPVVHHGIPPGRLLNILPSPHHLNDS
jgi:hypothetical protein